jgi:hypothetical protein
VALYFVSTEQGATALLSVRPCTSGCTTDAICSASHATESGHRCQLAIS